MLVEHVIQVTLRSIEHINHYLPLPSTHACYTFSLPFRPTSLTGLAKHFPALSGTCPLIESCHLIFNAQHGGRRNLGGRIRGNLTKLYPLS